MTVPSRANRWARVHWRRSRARPRRRVRTGPRPGSLPASRGRASSRPCPLRLPPSTPTRREPGARGRACEDLPRNAGSHRARPPTGWKASPRAGWGAGRCSGRSRPRAGPRHRGTQPPGSALAARGSARTAGSPRRSLAGAGSPRGHPGSRRGGRSPASPLPGTRLRAGSTVVPGHRGTRCRPRGSPGCSPRPTSPRWRSPRRRSIRGPLRRPGEGSPGRSSRCRRSARPLIRPLARSARRRDQRWRLSSDRWTCRSRRSTRRSAH